jgi:hypothetical protein
MVYFGLPMSLVPAHTPSDFVLDLETIQTTSKMVSDHRIIWNGLMLDTAQISAAQPKSALRIFLMAFDEDAEEAVGWGGLETRGIESQYYFLMNSKNKFISHYWRLRISSQTLNAQDSTHHMSNSPYVRRPPRTLMSNPHKYGRSQRKTQHNSKSNSQQSTPTRRSNSIKRR